MVFFPDVIGKIGVRVKFPLFSDNITAVMSFYSDPNFLAPRTSMSTFHDLKMEAINGETVSFSEYRDQVLLIVNLASQ